MRPGKILVNAMLTVSLLAALVASRSILVREEPDRHREATITSALGDLLRRAGREEEAAGLETITPASAR